MLVARYSALAFVLAQSAQPTPKLEAATIWVLGGVMSLLGMALLIVSLAIQCRNLFARKPAIEVDLQAKADAKDVSRLQVDIQGFVTSSAFEAHKEEVRLRTVGLEKQISDARHDFAKTLQVLTDDARNLSEETAGDLTKLREELTGQGKQLAKLDERSENVKGTVDNFDRKLDRLFLERRQGV